MVYVECEPVDMKNFKSKIPYDELLNANKDLKKEKKLTQKELKLKQRFVKELQLLLFKYMEKGLYIVVSHHYVDYPNNWGSVAMINNKYDKIHRKGKREFEKSLNKLRRLR